MSLGEMLTQSRKKKNLTQEEVAQKIGVTRQAISNWELDKSQPDFDTLMQLSNLMDCNFFKPATSEDSPTSKEKHTKSLNILYIMQALITLIYIGLGIHNNWAFENMLICIILLLCSTTVYFLFGFAIKNNDFTMISGYNKNANYNLDTLKKVIINIELNILLQGVLATVLYIAVTFLVSENLLNIFIFIILIVYIINIIGISIYINIQNSDKLYLNKTQNHVTKMSYIPTTIFTAEILLLITSTIICFEKYGIENNTPPALKITGLILLSTALSTINSFVEQKKVKQASEKNTRYVLSIHSYITLLVNLFIIVGIFYIGNH